MSERFKVALMEIGAMLIVVVLVMTMTYTQTPDRQIDESKYRDAEVRLPDGEVITGKVENLVLYNDTNLVEITVDGKKYLVSTSNLVLMGRVDDTQPDKR